MSPLRFGNQRRNVFAIRNKQAPRYENQFFVAHPYRGDFPSEEFREALASIENEFRVRFFYADKVLTADYLLTKLKNSIQSSGRSLFDVTYWNPNVTLELGLAYGLGEKDRILISLNTSLHGAERVPSDLAGIDRLEYSDFPDFKTQFIEKHIETRFLPTSVQYLGAQRIKVLEELLKVYPQGLNRQALWQRAGIPPPQQQTLMNSLTQHVKMEMRGQGPIYFYRLPSEHR
ncbi:MAG: hypothetical protein JRN35_10035 [Nitrososphaerota archaeon]|nr:hypothetical protein [Nitrososphaerota archaeon]